MISSLRKESSPAKRQAQKATATEQEISSGEKQYDNISDAFQMKYKVDNKGIGHIYLPPSLSMILQSDQIRISPSVGGLFIQSIGDRDALDLQSAKLLA